MRNPFRATVEHVADGVINLQVASTTLRAARAVDQMPMGGNGKPSQENSEGLATMYETETEGWVFSIQAHEEESAYPDPEQMV
eukprot:4810152-Amphidinium_carterae.4